MILLCIILSIITIICLTLLLSMLHDIKKINEQIDYKNQHESHFEIFTQSNQNQIKKLQNHLNALYEEIQAIQEQASKKEKEMQTLMSGISHDIRTPLTSMQGYLKLIDETKDEKEKKKYLKTIEYRLDTLKAILEDLFLHSKISDCDYKLQKENIEIYPLICKVMASFYYDFEEKGIEPVIHFSNEHLQILANQDMIIRMIQNLINNVLKHGKDSFEIREENGVIYFMNTIAQSDQIDVESLFDRFYKNDHARHSDSTGLGLSIVKEIVQKHNWKIDAIIEHDLLKIRIDLK